MLTPLFRVQLRFRSNIEPPGNANPIGFFMPTRKPLISYSDHRQLLELLDQGDVSCIVEPRTLMDLRLRLNTALVIEDERIPASVVTMESVVQLRDPASDDADVFTLVFPEHADIARGNLSVMAPLGIAILGRHVGQIVRARVPSGIRSLEVVDILFQPERDDQILHAVCRVPKTTGNRQRHSLATGCDVQ